MLNQLSCTCQGFFTFCKRTQERNGIEVQRSKWEIFREGLGRSCGRPETLKHVQTDSLLLSMPWAESQDGRDEFDTVASLRELRA